MREYGIRQRLKVCVLGLALLAGCNHLGGREDVAPCRTGCRPCAQACTCTWRQAGPCGACGGAAPALRPAPATPAARPVPAEQPKAPAPLAIPAEALPITPPLRAPAALDRPTDCVCSAPTTAPCRACEACRPCPAPPPCTICPPCPCPATPIATLSFAPAEDRASLTAIEAPRPLPDGIGDVERLPAGGARRRSFTDLTAAACFGHAPDYHWVSGQVEYCRIRKEWRLRYASVDETDRYGGRLVLVENEHLGYLSDGQYVRVEGHLVTPADTAGGTGFYRIEAFRVIDKPNRAPPTAN